MSEANEQGPKGLSCHWVQVNDFSGNCLYLIKLQCVKMVTIMYYFQKICLMKCDTEVAVLTAALFSSYEALYPSPLVSEH